MKNQMISTYFVGLDKYFKGMNKSSLIYICAKPGMGMKTFAKNFINDIVKENHQFFSLFEFCRENEMTVSEIKQDFEVFIPDGIYIDCLQPIAPDMSRENKSHEMSDISYELKSMAKAFDATIVCTVQMLEYKGKPTLNDLNKIGSIAKDADVVLFLHRDDFTSNNIANIDPDITELIIAKNNYGDTGAINLKFNSETKQFTEMDD